MNKKQLEQSLSALMGGGSAAPEEPQQTAAPEEPQQTAAPAAPKEETDLINSVEDEELKAALLRKRAERRGRPRMSDNVEGLPADYARTSFIIRKDRMAKIKEIAFRETLTMKEIVDLALSMVIEGYEAKHGEVKPRTHRGDINNLL